MKAAFFDSTGAPEVIRYGDLPKPTPGQGEVLVKVDETNNTKIRFSRNAIHRVIVEETAAAEKK